MAGKIGGQKMIVREYPFLSVGVLGYLLGAIPTAYWLCRIIYKINIFEHGSRNMGATNVHRVLGTFPFALTLILDILKGLTTVVVSVYLFATAENFVMIQIVSGAAAIAGHTLSFWVGFRGGKGVATGLGVFLAIAPKAGIASMMIFILTLIASGFVSLGSIFGSAFLPVFIFLFKEGGSDWNLWFTAFSAIIALFIIFKHKANIRRLLKGEELSLKMRSNVESSHKAS